jgi:hypothetical protein
MQDRKFTVTLKLEIFQQLQFGLEYFNYNSCLINQIFILLQIISIILRYPSVAVTILQTDSVFKKDCHYFT